MPKKYSCLYDKEKIPDQIKYTDNTGKVWIFQKNELVKSVIENKGNYVNPYTKEDLPDNIKNLINKILTYNSCKVLSYLYESGYLQDLENDKMYQFIKEGRTTKGDFLIDTILNKHFTTIDKIKALVSLKQDIPFIVQEYKGMPLSVIRSKSNEILTKHGLTWYNINIINMNKLFKTVEEYNNEIDKTINEITNLEYKIHLQPKSEHLLDTIKALLSIDKKLKDCSGDCIEQYKMSYVDPEYLKMMYSENLTPSIVVYPKLGYAKKVLEEIISTTNPSWGTGYTPRGNIKVNDLVYYAGGNWDDKKNPLNKEYFNKDLTLYKNQEPLLLPQSTQLIPKRQKIT
jgi:hypothetical protein